MDQMNPIRITIRFHQHLRPLLRRAHRQTGLVNNLKVMPWTSIKDVVESLQVPHTEVGKLLVCGRQVGFSHQVCGKDFIEVLPLVPPVDPCTPTLLRPEALTSLRFMVDVNVARLGNLLRMAGIDTAYMPNLCDKDIAAMVVREERIILSRDRGLLKRKIIIHGHLVRSQQPNEQLNEIIQLYGLKDLLQPFSRCMQCNGILSRIEKSAILNRLEPLTRKYYKSFYICSSCDKIYWSGSHKEGMNRILTTLRHALKNGQTDHKLKEQQA